jgi:Multidrug resistance efflux pump
MNTKEQLLKELSMERAVPATRSKRVVWPVFAAGLLVSLPVVAYYQYSNIGDTSKSVALDSKSLVLDAAPELKDTYTLEARSVSAPKSSTDTSRELNARAALEASGYIVARRMATVSAKNFGLITSINVEEGTYIKKGEVIATLDDAQARVDLELLQSQSKSLLLAVHTKELELEQALNVLAREEQLHSSGYSNDANYSRLGTQVKSLQNQIEVAQSQYETSIVQVKKQQTLLNDYVITAPFSGVVTEKNAQLGEIISPSTAGGGYTRTGLCTIVDMDSLEIVVDVNESFIERISKNQKIVGELYAYPGWKFSGQVVRIIPTADRAKATIRVRIKIADVDSKILPEMGVKVSFAPPKA